MCMLYMRAPKMRGEKHKQFSTLTCTVSVKLEIETRLLSFAMLKSS